MIQIVHSKIKNNQMSILNRGSVISLKWKKVKYFGRNIFRDICYRADVINITNEGVFQVSSKSKKIHFFIKTNLNKNSDTKIDKKNKNRLRTFWYWEIQKTKN